ncbi:MAG TPA: cupin domain-containing protein [Chloroflexi bacterium]|jgi:quercetin dioxygenase-like cupin family protein|nr:cupin domain-containing protein [Chloroflexota bacterium]HAF18913.1 cupin domain-containing protein [Chloroflexota bacterium]
MARRGEVIEDPMFGERMTFLDTSADTNGELLRLQLVVPVGGRVPFPHAHPRQQESFDVQHGTLSYRLGFRRSKTLGQGERLVIPHGALHAWWNAADSELTAIVEFRPAFRTEIFLETTFGLFRDRRVHRSGVPNIWQLAALMSEFRHEMWVPSPLSILFRVLGPAARARGYRAWYSEYSPDLPAPGSTEV